MLSSDATQRFFYPFMHQFGVWRSALTPHIYFIATLCFFAGFNTLLLSGIDDSPPYGLRYYIGCILLAAAPVIALARFMRLRGVDGFAIFCFIIAAVVSLHHIYISHTLYTMNDLPGHSARIEWIASHFSNPFSYTGWWLELPQSHHPIVFYYLAAIFYNISKTFYLADPWVAVRFFSWANYLLFNVYGVLTLRCMKTTRAAYMAAVMLLVLWPRGLHASGWISNDPMLYGVYAAAFYYIVRWYKEKNQRILLIAIALSSLALAVKTNAILLFGILGILMAHEIWKGYLRIERGLFRGYFITVGILLVSVLLNTIRLVLGESDLSHHFGARVVIQSFDINHFISLDWSYPLIRPFFITNHPTLFHEFFLKTSIFSIFLWPWEKVAMVMHCILLAIIFYTILAWFISTKRARKDMLPIVLGFFVPYFFVMFYTTLFFQYGWKDLVHAQDFRYAYPILIPCSIFFMRAMEIYRKQQFSSMQYVGWLLAFGFSSISVVFFWVNGR